MPWESIKNPTKKMLDDLYQEQVRSANKPCPDCGVKPGKAHSMNCDVARCQACGGQRLSCGCKKPGEDVWDGLWPGTKECYEKGYVAKWVSGWPFDSGRLIFDYDRWAVERVTGSRPSEYVVSP
jgi:hypothetical protein